jgi:mRNA-degrading endonuclease RelE of RelBE toxin-antitoxin system
MNFRIADTFTNSLARLTGDEQKAVKTTAFDLQMNPASPGMSFHKLDKAKDKNFWSVRVNSDIRLIVHKTQSSLLLCYVDHHDKAYDWAERRKLETHPKTGAAQLVEIRETVQEIKIPKYIEEAKPKSRKAPKSLFQHISDDELLGYGVPPEWLADVKTATEDNYLTLADHLPCEAAEALLELATGGKPRVVKPAGAGAEPFEHPDALRRFRVMSNVEELQRALDFPWEKWTVFLHPEQREIVEKKYNGPAKVSGSAGTGKTIVALHRTVYLAKANPECRILLATFSQTLSYSLQTKLKRLLGPEPRLADRIDVASLDELGLRLYQALIGKAKLVERSALNGFIKAASSSVPSHKFTMPFLVTEWEQIVDPWQVKTWEEYRNVPRLGRKARLSEAQRTLLWSIFAKVWDSLDANKVVTLSTVFTKLADKVSTLKNPPYDFAIVDECQDLGVAQLKFFAAIGKSRDEALFLAGDSGQRIFQQAFSWKSLGIDIRGRSRTLRVNYRTSHQIRTQADKLLGPEVSDVDGNSDQRDDTISLFNGPLPTIAEFDTEKAEQSGVASWLQQQFQSGVLPQECGIIVRSEDQLERAQSAAKMTGIAFKVLDEHVAPAAGHLSICTMHLAKGLEFRAVVVMACDDEVVPLQSRIESVGEESDLKEVYDTERHLLYVACTRARDALHISGVKPVSEFLDDLRE